MTVDEHMAAAAMKQVELFLNTHPDYDMRVRERDDGTIEYRLVKKDAPCFSE